MYLIEILHQTTTIRRVIAASCGCILSKFYIKPQHGLICRAQRHRCILSKFYIKPQLNQASKARSEGCILSKFYIKPQRIEMKTPDRRVVSYRNSTSNHNRHYIGYFFIMLYLIEILHQTTTTTYGTKWNMSCILSKFYIKPQPSSQPTDTGYRCILSKFYIKPQLTLKEEKAPRCCILSKFYIKPQRLGLCVDALIGCILSKFYIKPQQVRRVYRRSCVVSYRNSTSNHNSRS